MELKENQPSFFGRFKIPIIVLLVIILVAISVFVIFKLKRSINQPSSPQPNASLSANTKSLFGTMIAFNINEAPMDTPGIIDTLRKGWTEFRKDNSAYENLKSNLEKLIQDRTKLVQATGFSFDREVVPFFTWNVIEPQKGQFDWELTDMYVKGAANAGVKISAVIQPFAGWDQKNTQTNREAQDFAFWDYKAGPPNDLAEYENFLIKTVERYKDKVVVWEISNEPENPGGGYQNNPEGYFDLVKITSETIKKADPEAKVTNGGAMPVAGMRESDSFKAYWTKFFALGGGKYLDYFNVHYNIERSQDAKLDPAIFQEDLTFFNNLMDKNGGRKPLYLTEFGIYSGTPSEPPGQNLAPPSPSNQNGPAAPNQGKQAPSPPSASQSLPNVSQDAQAALYFKDSILAFANGVNFIFIDLVGSDNNIIGSSMAFNTDDKPRLFLATIKMINQKLAGFTKVEKIAEGQYKFSVNNKVVYAFWAGKMPTEISNSAKITNFKGQTTTQGIDTIILSPDEPILVE